MAKRKREIAPDVELDAAVRRAIDAGIPLSTVCRRAEVDQSTLWKWRTGRTSATMSTRKAVLDAIQALVGEGAR